MIILRALAAAAGEGAGAGGPSGPPTNAYRYRVANPIKMGVHWTNGDPTAGTRVYYNDVAVFESATHWATAAPGAESIEFTRPDEAWCYYWVLHIKSGIKSAETDAFTGSGDLPDCEV